MKRTLKLFAVTLALGAGAGCRDSNPGYITFDAQATDTRADAPPAGDGSTLDGAARDGASDAPLDGQTGDIVTADASDATNATDGGLDLPSTDADTNPATADGGTGQ